MSDHRLAMAADKALQSQNSEDRPYHVSTSDLCGIPWGMKAAVSGTVIYAGSGFELSPLFLFEDARQYIHQDPCDAQLSRAFKCLEEHGIIEGFQTISDIPGERKHEFKYKGRSKTVVELFNSKKQADKHIHDGNVALNVHPLVQEGLDAIYFFAVPWKEIVMAIQINLLPHLKIGGVFEGSYYSLYRYGAPSSHLGLEHDGKTFRKIRQLTSPEIEDTVGYTIDDYIREELQFPWVLDRDKPKIRQEAEKRGVRFRQSNSLKSNKF